MGDIIEISKRTLQSIDKAESLDAKQRILFDKWKEVHCDEEDWRITTTYGQKTIYNCSRNKLKEVVQKYIHIPNESYFDDITFPGIEQDSFVEDGFIDEGNYLNAPCKILFVLKEANILEERKSSEEAQNRSQVEWYKQFIYYGGKDNKSKQLEKLARIAYYIFETKKNKEDINQNVYLLPDEERYKKALSQIAFINLNKRGGDNTEKKVKAYTGKYRRFISKQIEILNPDYIICLGTGLKNLLINYDIVNQNNVYMFELWHPSYGMQKVPNTRAIDNLIDYDKGIAKYMYYFLERYRQ
jgi:hypothetical protein